MQSLIDSIYWCYLSTGPEATEHQQERARIYELIPIRDALKSQRASGNGELWGPEQEQALAAVRAELKSLIGAWKKTGYQYTGQIYREISMQNSDYGGMENVGNTTILASRMVPSDLLGDAGQLRALSSHAVSSVLLVIMAPYRRLYRSLLLWRTIHRHVCAVESLAAVYAGCVRSRCAAIVMVQIGRD